MRTIHCIIVDDEPLARDLIQTYVSRLENWEISKVCMSAAEAYEALCRETIDILFLDIEMPLLSGLDFLRSLKNPPLIIFTTAHAQYAVNAFDLGVVDYLLKPVTEERFLQAAEKAQNLLALPSLEHMDMKKMGIPPKEERLPPKVVDHVFFRQDSRMVKVMLDDILYVEALKDFSKIYLKNNTVPEHRTMLVGSHLKLIEELLPAEKFIRTHRSYMIALNAVTAIQGNIIEIGKQQIPLGGIFKQKVLKRLNLPS
ncbi:LytR/AlgR family response regulator transcription factor [Flavitalea flava]